MTVTNLERRREYIGDGASTDFTFNIPFDLANDLKVFVDGAAQSEGFQVNGAGSPTGGSVVFTTPPETGKAVVIVLDPGLLQTLDLPNSGGGAAALGLIERGLDRCVRMIQSLADRFARAITLPEGQIDGQGRYDAGGNKFGNIGEATEDSDAVSKGYLDSQISGAVTAAQSAEEDAQAVGEMRNEVVSLKEDVIQAKDAAEAAKVAAEAATPISASTKGRELIAKATEAEMRTVLGAASDASVQAVVDALAEKATIAALNALQTQVNNFSGAPIGSTLIWDSPTLPDDYLERNGATLSRADFSELWAFVNGAGIVKPQASKQHTEWGDGDGSTTFSLPDWRAEHLIGWDNGRGVDAGRGLLTWQADAVKSHRHIGGVKWNSGANIISSFGYDTVGGWGHQTAATNDGYTTQHFRPYTSTEGAATNRVRTVAVMFLVKFR